MALYKGTKRYTDGILVKQETTPSFVTKSPYTDENGKFVKPSEWDDIESITLSETDQVLYLLYDNTLDFSWCSITVTCDTGSSICDYGRVVNGAFQVLDSETKASRQSYQRCLSDDFPNEDYVVLRIRPASTNNLTILATSTFKYNNRNLDATYQPILMRYGSLPKATSIVLRANFLVSDNIKNLKEITSLNGYLYNCYNLARFRHDGWNTNKVIDASTFLQNCIFATDIDTDFSGWFADGKLTKISNIFDTLKNVQEINVTGWNMQNVTNIASAFNGCINLKKIIGIEGWYLPNCVSTANYKVFMDCHMLEQDNGKLDLSNWHFAENVTNSTIWSAFFTNALKLKQIDISNFNLRYATNISNMFDSVSSLESVTFADNIGSELRLTSYGSIFNNCYFIKKIDFSTINASMISAASIPFANCFNLREFVPPAIIKENIYLTTDNSLSHDSLVAVLNSLATVTSAKTLSIGTINLSKLTADEIAIATNKGWTLA